MSTPDRPFVDAVSEAVRAVLRSPHGGAFMHAVDTYGAALSAVRMHNPAHVSAEDIQRLQVEAERVIEAIERRIDSGGDKPAIQLDLAESVYDIRRKLEKLFAWRQRHTESPA